MTDKLEAIRDALKTKDLTRAEWVQEVVGFNGYGVRGEHIMTVAKNDMIHKADVLDIVDAVLDRVHRSIRAAGGVPAVLSHIDALASQLADAEQGKQILRGLLNERQETTKYAQGQQLELMKQIEALESRIKELEAANGER